MAAVILLQSSPKQTAKQPRPPALSRLQLWKMPLQRESVGEYLWDPKSKWVLAEIFLYTVLFMKYPLFDPPAPGRLFICAVITAGKSSISVLGDAGCRQSWDPSLSCCCCPMGAGGGGWTFSRLLPDLLQTSPIPLPGLEAPVRLSDGERAQDAEPGAAPIPEHQLFWSHLRGVSLAQAARAALLLEGVGKISNLKPFGVTQALLTDSFSLWILLRHPMEHSLDPTAVPISNEMSK